MPSLSKLLTGAISSLSDRQLGALPAHTYSPLPHARSIRLLELHPQSSGILLSCTQHVCDLDSDIVFDALSYTWGNPMPPIHHTPPPSIWTVKRPLLCNGAIIKINTNLHTALRRLRSYYSKPGSLTLSRFIWVDAVCINQADTAERSAQVSLMEDIYSGAHNVIAWLGWSDRETGEAIQYINHLAQFPDSEYDGSNAWTLQQKGVPQSGARALVGLFMREWFNRAWIVQEAVLAERLTILCGEYQLDWDVLVRCSSFMMSSISPADVMRYQMVYLSREQLQSGGMVKRAYGVGGLHNIKEDIWEAELETLVSYVFLGRVRNATDPRDRAFAMLGLLKKNTHIRNDPKLMAKIPTTNYSKSVAEVFADCAILTLDLSEKIPLFLLSVIEEPSRRSPELLESLPSWVPDITVPLSPGPLIRICPSKTGNTGPDVRLWDPCADYNDNVANAVPIDRRILCLQGAMLDTITHGSIPIENSKSSFNWVHVLEAFRSVWGTTVSGTVFMDALWRTLVANMERPSAGAPAGPHFGWGFVESLIRRTITGRACYDRESLIDVLTQASVASGERAPIAPEKIHQCLTILRGPQSQQAEAIHARIEAYQGIMESVCGDRRLFLTRGQYLGIGARSAEIGDQVWIFPGANVPFILRPVAAGRFRLVGEAYVHGVMYGEAAPSLIERYQDVELE